MEDMGKEAVWDMVQQLQAGLQAREKQLERQGEQLANMQEVQQQLQVCRPCCTVCLKFSMIMIICSASISICITIGSFCRLHANRLGRVLCASAAFQVELVNSVWWV